MKRRDKENRPKIYLIAEDKTGYFVLAEIVQKNKIAADVILRGKAAGVSTLAKEIRELIDELLEVISKKDCIVLVHDTDISVQSHRADYQMIEQVCNSYAGRVTRLEATQEIEAWLLADKAFCAWLGVKPKASDHVRKPSEKLERMIKKKFNHRMWTDSQKRKILHDHFDVTGEKFSDSMRIAMQTFQQLPCAKQA